MKGLELPVGESVTLLFRCEGCSALMQRTMPDLKRIRAIMSEVRDSRKCPQCVVKREQSATVLTEK